MELLQSRRRILYVSRSSRVVYYLPGFLNSHIQYSVPDSARELFRNHVDYDERRLFRIDPRLYLVTSKSVSYDSSQRITKDLNFFLHTTLPEGELEAFLMDIEKTISSPRKCLSVSPLRHIFRITSCTSISNYS